MISNLSQLALAGVILASGCCLAPRCPSGGYALGGACGHDGCDQGGCDQGGCDQGGCEPIWQSGCRLGAGCLGRLFHKACSSAACGGGCGEVYWNDWINSPPRPDPCDVDGRWQGVGVGDAMDVGLAGPGFFSKPILVPACGGPNFKRTGRFLFGTWVGASRFCRHLRSGLAPCMHFGCQTCGAPYGVASCPSCDAGATTYVTELGADGSHSLAQDIASFSPETAGVATNSARPSRPPHPVVARRLRR